MMYRVCVSERERAAKTLSVQRWRQPFNNVLYGAEYSQTLDSYALCLSCQHALRRVCDWISLLSRSLSVPLYVCELNTRLVIQHKQHYCLVWSDGAAGFYTGVHTASHFSKWIYLHTFRIVFRFFIGHWRLVLYILKVFVVLIVDGDWSENEQFFPCMWSVHLRLKLELKVRKTPSFPKHA